MSKIRLVIIYFFLLFILPVSCCGLDNSLNVERLNSSNTNWVAGEFFEANVDYVLEPFPSSVSVPYYLPYVSKSRLTMEQQREVIRDRTSITPVGILVGLGILFSWFAIPAGILLLIVWLNDKTKKIKSPGDVESPKIPLIILFLGIGILSGLYIYNNYVSPYDPSKPVETIGWYPNDTSSYDIWVDNGRSESIIVYNMSGKEWSEIPPTSILRLEVSSGILNMGLKTRSGVIIKSIKLNIEPSSGNSLFIYNIDKNNRYKIETQMYKY